MHNKKINQSTLKATVIPVIVAFIYTILILGTPYLVFAKDINEVFSLINLISNDTNEKLLDDIKIDLTTKNIETYPEYGSKYATLSIPSINLTKPIYYGDTLDVLRYGIGHDIASYFPGEGGSVLYMGHNTSDMLRKLPEVEVGASIIVTTSYGTYEYIVSETKVIKDTDTDQVPIQREEEILMIYTCYPVTTVVYTPYRYVVYANLKK